jgi:hypothetical protein
VVGRDRQGPGSASRIRGGPGSRIGKAWDRVRGSTDVVSRLVAELGWVVGCGGGWEGSSFGGTADRVVRRAGTDSRHGAGWPWDEKSSQPKERLDTQGIR